MRSTPCAAHRRTGAHERSRVRAADNVHSAGTHVQIKTGGKLVILSGNNWTKAHTPRNSWLGGFLLNGEPLKTLDAFKHAFKRSFKLEHVEVRTRGNQQCRRVACVDVCNARHNMCGCATVQGGVLQTVRCTLRLRIDQAPSGCGRCRICHV